MNLLHSGKLGGFTQENNTIDSGELDIGRRAIQEVPPGIFWRSQLFIDQPQFLKFNISLQKDALIGVYGRKGLPPSHTQVGSAADKMKPASLHFWSHSLSYVQLFNCWPLLYWSLTVKRIFNVDDTYLEVFELVGRMVFSSLTCFHHYWLIKMHRICE